MFRFSLRQILLLSVLIALMLGYWQAIRSLCDATRELQPNFGEIVFSPDGESIASSYYGNEVLIYDHRLRRLNAFHIKGFGRPNRKSGGYVNNVQFVSQDVLQISILTWDSTGNDLQSPFRVDLGTGEQSSLATAVFSNQLNIHDDIQALNYAVKFDSNTGQVTVTDLTKNKVYAEFQTNLVSDVDKKSLTDFSLLSSPKSELIFLVAKTYDLFTPAGVRRQKSLFVEVRGLNGKKVGIVDVSSAIDVHSSPSGKFLVFDRYKDIRPGIATHESLLIMDTSADNKRIEIEFPYSVFNLKFSNDEALMLVEKRHFEKNSIEVYDMSTFKLLQSIPIEQMWHFGIRPGTRHLYVDVTPGGFASKGPMIQVWDIETGNLVETFGSRRNLALYYVSFSAAFVMWTLTWVYFGQARPNEKFCKTKTKVVTRVARLIALVVAIWLLVDLIQKSFRFGGFDFLDPNIEFPYFDGQLRFYLSGVSALVLIFSLRSNNRVWLSIHFALQLILTFGCWEFGLRSWGVLMPNAFGVSGICFCSLIVLFFGFKNYRRRKKGADDNTARVD